MRTLTELTALVERFAAAIPDLNLGGDEQEEYSTMLLRLQYQAETGQPSEAIVNECLDYFKQLESRAAELPRKALGSNVPSFVSPAAVSDSGRTNFASTLHRSPNSDFAILTDHTFRYGTCANATRPV